MTRSRPYTLHTLKLRNEHQTQNAHKLVKLDKFREFVPNYGELSFYGYDEECPIIKAFLRSKGTEDDLNTLCSLLRIDLPPKK